MSISQTAIAHRMPISLDIIPRGTDGLQSKWVTSAEIVNIALNSCTLGRSTRFEERFMVLQQRLYKVTTRASSKRIKIQIYKCLIIPRIATNVISRDLCLSLD